jgi:hypothetical protein
VCHTNTYDTLRVNTSANQYEIEMYVCLAVLSSEPTGTGIRTESECFHHALTIRPKSEFRKPRPGFRNPVSGKLMRPETILRAYRYSEAELWTLSVGSGVVLFHPGRLM